MDAGQVNMNAMKKTLNDPKFQAAKKHLAEKLHGFTKDPIKLDGSK